MKQLSYTILAGILATIIYGAFFFVLLPLVMIAVAIEWLWNWQERNRIQNAEVSSGAKTP